jgi:hypothetical protein
MKDKSAPSTSGQAKALSKNPNEHPPLNDEPDGPYAVELGSSGHGGMHGATAVKGKHGGTFHFK